MTTHLCPKCQGTGWDPDHVPTFEPVLDDAGVVVMDTAGGDLLAASPRTPCPECGGDGLADNAAGDKVRKVQAENHPDA